MTAAAQLRAALDPKLFSTLQARCALAGAVLEQVESDDGRPLLVVTREAVTLRFGGPGALERVEGWLVEVAAR